MITEFTKRSWALKHGTIPDLERRRRSDISSFLVGYARFFRREDRREKSLELRTIHHHAHAVIRKSAATAGCHRYVATRPILRAGRDTTEFERAGAGSDPPVQQRVDVRCFILRVASRQSRATELRDPRCPPAGRRGLSGGRSASRRRRAAHVPFGSCRQWRTAVAYPGAQICPKPSSPSSLRTALRTALGCAA